MPMEIIIILMIICFVVLIVFQFIRAGRVGTRSNMKAINDLRAKETYEKREFFNAKRIFLSEQLYVLVDYEKDELAVCDDSILRRDRIAFADITGCSADAEASPAVMRITTKIQSKSEYLIEAAGSAADGKLTELAKIVAGIIAGNIAD